MDAVTLAAANAAARKNTAPWSVVSHRPVKSGDSATASTTTGFTTRLTDVAPFDLGAVRFVYANWQNAFGSSESPNYSGYRVKAAIHKAGTAAPDRATTDWLALATFNGNEFGYCAPGALLLSDPIPVGIKAGERWWHEHYGDVFLPAGPTAPTVTAIAGSGNPTGTAFVAVTYVYPDGTESLPSPEGTATLTTGNTGIQVTSPTAPGGLAIGWRAYVNIGGTANAVKYESPSSPMAPFGTNITISSSFTTSSTHRLVRSPTHPGLPVGRGLLGTVGQGSIGEGSVSGKDWVAAALAWTGGPSFAGMFGPIGVLGLAADGKRHTSVCLVGDSIQAGTGDTGYGGALGGFVFRACANQTQQMAYDSTRTPNLGFLTVAQGGEAASAFATVGGGARRSQVAELATTIVDNYGTNDLGSGSAVIYANLLTIFQRFQGRKRYLHTTISPKTGSTDNWLTLANQAIPSTDAEGDRRALNNCFKGTTGAVAVTGEALFRSPGTAGPATVLTGGDGAAVKFYTAYPFQTGTETVQVNGTTKAVTTDYTYRQTAVIGGVTYASGIQFTTAPANGATVTAGYTKAASFGSMTGWTGTIDAAAAIEVNGSGAAGTNGGFWKAAVTTGGLTGTVSTASGTVLNDTAQTWTADQWRGYVVQITADTTTPASVGQMIAVQSNTPTQLKLAAAWTTAPSSVATYQIYRPHTIDGTHPTSYGHMLKSQAVDVTKF